MNPGSVVICTYSHQIRPLHQLRGYSMARDETMSLFHLPDEEVGTVQSDVPLAERMRPRTLDEFVGQEHLVGEGRLIRGLVQAGGPLPSLIL